MEMCGMASGPTGMSIAGAPTVEEFKAAWIAAGKCAKISQRDADMQENILEATLEREQEFLKTVETVCVCFPGRFQSWDLACQSTCMQFQL